MKTTFQLTVVGILIGASVAFTHHKSWYQNQRSESSSSSPSPINEQRPYTRTVHTSPGISGVRPTHPQIRKFTSSAINPASDRSEVLIGFDQERGERDEWYRRRVTRHIAKRYVTKNPAFETDAGKVVLELFRTNGLTLELNWALVARGYEDATKMTGLGTAARLYRKEEAEGTVKLPEEPELAQIAIRARREITAISESQQTIYKRMATERLKRETGITDPDFYEKLFSIEVTQDLGPINTNIEEDERIE